MTYMHKRSAFAACDNHLTGQLHKRGNSGTYTIVKVVGDENYKCTCGRSAVWFLRKVAEL